LRPNLGTKAGERLSIFFRPAARQKNAGGRNFLRQFAKNRPQFSGRSEAKIRRRQFSLIQNAQFIPGAFDQNPGRLGSAALNAKDFFAAFHCRPLPCLYLSSSPMSRLMLLSISLIFATRLRRPV